MGGEHGVEVQVERRRLQAAKGDDLLHHHVAQVLNISSLTVSAHIRREGRAEWVCGETKRRQGRMRCGHGRAKGGGALIRSG
jgi:hypothetical protein